MADGDLISRQAVLDALEVSYLKSEIDDDTYQRIRDMPSVAIPNKTGHWIERRNRATGHIESVCSECGAEEGYPYNDYCGNCGAKMD